MQTIERECEAMTQCNHIEAEPVYAGDRYVGHYCPGCGALL